MYILLITLNDSSGINTQRYANYLKIFAHYDRSIVLTYNYEHSPYHIIVS